MEEIEKLEDRMEMRVCTEEKQHRIERDWNTGEWCPEISFIQAKVEHTVPVKIAFVINKGTITETVVAELESF